MNGQNGQGEKQTHEIRIGMRKEMTVTGVREVLRFDDACVVLRSVCGEMTVEGQELRVGILDTDRGLVTLSGTVEALYYTEDRGEERKRWFQRR